MKIPKQLDINKVSDKPLSIDVDSIKKTLFKIGKKQKEIIDTIGVAQRDTETVNKAIIDVEDKLTDFLIAQRNREQRLMKQLINADKGEQMRENQQITDYLEGEVK